MSKGKPRLSRGAQAKARERRAGLDPEAWRRLLLTDERGTITRDAPLRIALCYPLPYRVAMSSLGFQVIYRMLNSRPGISCERVFLPDDVVEWRRRGWRPISLETGRPLAEFDILAFSITYDLDLIGVFELLDMAGVPALRSERRDSDPLVIFGGPLTASNPLPMGPFVDLGIIGDGEVATARLLDVLETVHERDAVVTRAAAIPGAWAPALHGDRVPPTQKVTEGLPAIAQIVTPHTELSNMFLVEASRGCPRFCKFCLVRAPESPMRESDVDRLFAAIPDDVPRVGFVGAAVSEWSGIREAMRRVVARGQGLGISSLRADRLDAEFVELLVAGGFNTMTVASDAASQRLRNTLAKGIKTRHLLNAALLGKAAGMRRLKLYVIIGLPGETDADIDELIAFTREMAAILPTALGVSPLVPKLHTPLGDAPFAGMPAVDRTLKRLKRELKGVADVRSTSARWAWVEYRLSQGAEDAGLAAYAAWQAGGRFADWKAALGEADERGGLRAAQRHRLFAAAGMK